MTPRYRGIIPPMVTPLTARDRLDVVGLERLVERLVTGGVAGLFALGTTGEAPSLSYRLRRDLIEHTCRFVRGRIPVLVGITDTSLVESATLACHAADCGADAVVTSAPFYFPAGQPELREFIEQLLPELPLPLMLYNMPALTKTSFSGEVVSWALDQEKIVGLKDSSGDLVYFRRMRRLAAAARPDWSFLVGPEELLAESVLLGGHGGINGGANLHPALYVSLYEAAKAGEVARARELSSQVMDLSEAIYRVGRHGSAIIKGLKCSLSILGVCDDFMAAPFHRFHEAEREIVRSRLDELGIHR
ncbi:MAG: dihydrodipicolinate synthase family protein [Verrucomicrobiales bacterium]|nr:dihydrodipicolinate synthase family protein [Verrucomicrobiales bacterium]